MAKGARKKQLSDEYVTFAALEYLLLRHEQRKPPCTVYDIMRRAPKLSTTQRHQRIEYLMKNLEDGGKVKSQVFENATYYEITKEGIEWHKTVMKPAYEILGLLYEWKV